LAKSSSSPGAVVPLRPSAAARRRRARTCERRRRPGALLVALLALGTGGCTALDNALASVPFLSFMRNSPSLDPYEAPRPAPPGSVPFSSPNGDILPPMAGTEAALNEFAAGPHGQNPLALNDSAAMALGQVMYNRHCAVCHGDTGQGNGPAVGPTKFPFAPNLTASPTTERADGYIYAIIRAGRGLMPSYGARTRHLERWAMVNYVRRLQALAPGLPARLPPTAPGDRPVLPQDTVSVRRDPTAAVRPDTLPQENR
jgi:mono/diheme cytochrome c family protein